MVLGWRALLGRFCHCSCLYGEFFFFQAEDGIRDLTVTGVQTCALPISGSSSTIRGLSRCPSRSSSPRLVRELSRCPSRSSPRPTRGTRVLSRRLSRRARDRKSVV